MACRNQIESASKPRARRSAADGNQPTTGHAQAGPGLGKADLTSRTGLRAPRRGRSTHRQALVHYFFRRWARADRRRHRPIRTGLYNSDPEPGTLTHPASSGSDHHLATAGRKRRYSGPNAVGAASLKSMVDLEQLDVVDRRATSKDQRLTWAYRPRWQAKSRPAARIHTRTDPGGRRALAWRPIRIDDQSSAFGMTPRPPPHRLGSWTGMPSQRMDQQDMRCSTQSTPADGVGRSPRPARRTSTAASRMTLAASRQRTRNGAAYRCA